MNAWIVKRVKTKCLLRLVAWAVVLTSIAYFGLGQHRYRYIQNFALNDESILLPGYIALASLLVLALVLAFFFVGQALPAWKHLRSPASHPVIQRISTWPVNLAVAAKREAHQPLYKGRNGWLVTNQFLIQNTFFTFNLLRLSDLLWAYRKVTQHSINFIPTGKTHEVILVCAGGTVTIEGREATTKEILDFATQRAPWAVFGFSKELEKLFNKDPNAFCAAVEQKRKEWTQQHASDTSRPVVPAKLVGALGGKAVTITEVSRSPASDTSTPSSRPIVPTDLLMRAFMPLHVLTGEPVTILVNDKYEVEESAKSSVQRTNPLMILLIIEKLFPTGSCSGTIIVSDGATDHPIVPCRVIHEESLRLYFQDHCPKGPKIFLEEGENLLGVKARKELNQEFSIGYGEYEQVIVAFGFVKFNF